MSKSYIYNFYEKFINDNLLTKNDYDNILQMFNNLKSYSFNDIYDNTTYLQKPKIKTSISSINGTTCILSKSVSLRNNVVIKHINISNDDTINNYRDPLYFNFCKEIYFQNIFFQEINKEEDNDIIIPNIIRYGITNSDNQWDSSIFFETQYYKQDYYTIDVNDDNIMNIYEKIKTKIDTQAHSFNFFSILQDKLQLYHNDLCDIQSSCNQLLENITDPDVDDIEKKRLLNQFINFHNCRGNLFCHNDKFVILDFERTFRRKPTNDFSFTNTFYTR